MKKLNWIIICSVAILAILNLSREDKPLQIEPMYAETEEYIAAGKPVMKRLEGFFYLRNFHNNKEDFKAILKLLQDSAYITNEDSETMKLKDEYWGEIEFCLSNRGYFRRGFIGCEGKSIGIILGSLESTELSIKHIRTDSKYTIFPTDISTPPDPENYEYQLDVKGDSAIVTIDYSELSTDILQQFLNVVDYYKDDIPIEKDGVNTYISQPNPPITYILKKEKSNNAEVIINYHSKNSSRFTIEII